MAFKMDCPHCMRTLNVTEKAMGRTVPCPGCDQPVAVPAQSPALCPMRQVSRRAARFQLHKRAGSLAADSAGATRNPPVPRAECTESETGTCAFCRKPWRWMRSSAHHVGTGGGTFTNSLTVFAGWQSRRSTPSSLARFWHSSRLPRPWWARQRGLSSVITSPPRSSSGPRGSRLASSLRLRSL